MDNYDLSNTPPSAQSADVGERYHRLTDEQNRQATFARRSTTVTKTEQAERQQLPSTCDGQVSEQRALADLNISLASTTPGPPTVYAPEDPYASLAAYRPLTFDENPKNQTLNEPASVNRKLLRSGNVMDNYDLSNLPPSGHRADTGEHHPWLMDEENRRATFSRQTATFSTLDQAQLQERSLTYEEQLSVQRVLADFDISLLPSTGDRENFHEPGDPFASLAAYRPLTLGENSENRALSELGLGPGFLKGFTAEALTDVVLAEPEESDGLEPSVQPEQRKQPEQSQGESEKGIVVPESANPDTVPDKRSRKRRTFKPRNVVIRERPTKSSSKKSTDSHFQGVLRRSKRLTKKRQKLDSTKIEVLPLPQGMAARRQSALLMPEKSATSQDHIGRSLDQSLRKRVEKETEKLTIVRESEQERFMCGYPGCGRTYKLACRLSGHIFSHIRISVYKCNYLLCAKAPYFRDASTLRRHMRIFHANDRPYLCELCNQCCERFDIYKEHMRNVHGTAP